MTGQRLDYWDANVFLAALLAGIAALVVVSLLTPPEPSPQMDELFERLETSSDDGAVRPLLLVNLLHLGRPSRARGSDAGMGGQGVWRLYREDLGGFALGWAIVIVLVAATALFLRYG